MLLMSRVPLAQSVISTIAVIWLSVTFAFVLLRTLPGDALESVLLQGGASQERVAQIRQSLGLDDSVMEQYLYYITALGRGDFGFSLASGRSVNALIAERLPSSLVLASCASFLGAALGILLGVLSAYRGAAALFGRLVIGVSLSTPVYWSGTLSILIFAVYLRWFPAYGNGTINGLVLPVFVLTFSSMGTIARVTQSSIHQFRDASYVLVARSRGLTRAIIQRRYILRNALPPVISVMALQFGFLLSGAVITETLFLRNGLGKLLIDSVVNQDYPVVQGIVVLSAVSYMTLNLLADLINQQLDPRLRG